MYPNSTEIQVEVTYLDLFFQVARWFLWCLNTVVNRQTPESVTVFQFSESQ